MQEIKLRITGNQLENGKENRIEFITEGLMVRDGDVTVIEYSEGQMYNMDNVHTRLRIEKNCIHMKREGDISTELVFVPEKTYEAVYDTPFGTMQIDIFPIRVRSTQEKFGGKVDIEYEVKVGDMRAHNLFNVIYETKNRREKTVCN